MSYQLPPVAGCVLHLDASVASSITHASGVVSQWNDLSGNGNNAVQATEAKKPLYGTDSTTGLGKVTFDGVAGANGDRMSIADHASLDLTTGITAFVACDTTSLDDYGGIFSKDDTTWTTAYRMVRSGATLPRRSGPPVRRSRRCWCRPMRPDCRSRGISRPPGCR